MRPNTRTPSAAIIPFSRPEQWGRFNSISVLLDHLAAAIAWAAMGVPVIPLREGSKGMQPAFKDPYSKATTDPEVIQDWATQYSDFGAAMGTKLSDGTYLLGIDLDVKGGKDGPGVWADLVAGLGHFDLADGSLIAQGTKSGGHHVVVRGPEALRLSAGKLGVGIDTRGGTSYLRIYEAPRVAEFRVLPPAVWEHIKAKIGTAKDRDPTTAKTLPPTEPAPPADVKAARAWLFGLAKDAISHVGGNTRTFATAAKLTHDFGLSMAQALEMMREWNAKLAEPWSDDELVTLVTNGFNHGSETIGSLAPSRAGAILNSVAAAVPDEVPATPETEKADHAFSQFESRVLSLREIVTRKWEPCEWLLYPFILAGHANLLAGPGGLGKSETTLLVALLLAAGRPQIFGRHGALKDDGPLVMQEDPRAPLPVLFITSEDHDTVGGSRLKKMLVHFKLANDAPIEYLNTSGCLVRVTDDGSIQYGDMFGWLKDRMMRMGGRGLVVLDPILTFASLDENKNGPVDRLFKAVLDPLCRQTGVTIVAIKHPSRAAQRDGQHIGGAEAWVNSPRNVTTFRSAGKDIFDRRPHVPRLWEVVKANYGGGGECIKLRYDREAELPVEASGITVQSQAVAEREAVLDAVRDLRQKGIRVQRNARGGGQGPKDLALHILTETSTSLAEEQVSEYLRDLERLECIRYTEAHGKVKATYEVVDLDTEIPFNPTEQ